ncbi:MAG: hypothetical protein DDT29_02027 [Dehalococcoidia bacterium]|nr:hypothetical protein [Bacillota bacterium]
MNSEVTFQSEGHTYAVDGKRIPSVTQIIEPLQDFSKVDPITLRAAQEFGNEVHAMTALWDQGTLDEEDLDIGLIPYLQGWKKFLKQTECEVYEIELAVHHEKHGYAGRMDRVAYLKRGRRKICAILDIKTGEAKNPVTGVQLAGYHAAYISSRKVRPPYSIYRIGVRLLASGDYRLDWWEDKSDWPTFLALLQITNWRRANGMNK